MTSTAEAVLIAHQRFDSGSCLCGWSELGKSHPAHQVQMLAEIGVLVPETVTLVDCPDHRMPERRYQDPVKAALSVAVASSVGLNVVLAQRIAEAVLASASGDLVVTERWRRREWENKRYQESTREHMHRELVNLVMRQRKVPVSLPVETLGYFMSRFGRDPVPPDEVEHVKWEYVEVQLAVPVRTPAEPAAPAAAGERA